MDWLLYLGMGIFSVLSIWFVKYFVQQEFPLWWKRICWDRWYKGQEYKVYGGQTLFTDAPLFLKIPTVVIIVLLVFVYFMGPMVLIAEHEGYFGAILFFGSFYAGFIYWGAYKSGQDSKTQTIVSLSNSLATICDACKYERDLKVEIEKADRLLREIVNKDPIFRSDRGE